MVGRMLFTFVPRFSVVDEHDGVALLQLVAIKIFYFYDKAFLVLEEILNFGAKMRIRCSCMLK